MNLCCNIASGETLDRNKGGRPRIYKACPFCGSEYYGSRGNCGREECQKKSRSNGGRKRYARKCLACGIEHYGGDAAIKHCGKPECKAAVRKRKPPRTNKCTACGKDCIWPYRTCSDVCYEERKKANAEVTRQRNAARAMPPHLKRIAKRNKWRKQCYRRRMKLQTVQRVAYRPSDILERDGYRCWVCGVECLQSVGVYDALYPSIDHVIPLCEGGDDAPWNVRCACLGCNRARLGQRSGKNAQVALTA